MKTNWSHIEPFAALYWNQYPKSHKRKRPVKDWSIYAGTGWEVELDGGGTVYLYDIDTPEIDELRAKIGTGVKVYLDGQYGRIERITTRAGFFGRWPNCPWEFDTNKRRLAAALNDRDY